jgi:hypothetical protein
MNLIDQAIVKAELRWLELPAHYRWFVGCTATAILLGMTGGMLDH